ncbi:CubicO group peptidase (beta-lactamase class C family) [Crossiella equi]|uniref:CubicO group peptidase (Beta-lactamase class C family) n=1 Tax=Crossiella equi TaxID=130796 RepID=A0ABS5ASY8_9PSEU|nr:serine hydrolase domain-containing protein [Crossiella equi]MBP2479342.1 CubicO group peptidase (beta-lactamase class C family) [Crossiella equi]
MLAELATRHRVPGAQLATAEDTTVVGSLTAASAVPLGSLTKPCTAALVVLLAQDGDLDLHAPLSGQPFTAAQLLSHTAGLASDLPAGAELPADRRAWLAWHRPRPVHEPGTVFSYSNLGYLVAGALVEQITGMTWAEAVTDILLDPLGITPGFVLGDSPRPVATGHSALGARVVAVGEDDLPEVEAPAGALALSADDLRALALGLPEQMRTDQLAGTTIGPYGMAAGWGLGWAAYPDGWWGHDGTGAGTSCHLRFRPATGEVLALTTTANTGHQLWRELVHETTPTGRAEPPDCLGRYTNGEVELAVEPGPDGPLLVLGGRPHSRLVCHEGGRFSAHELTGHAVHAGRFVTGPDGRAEYLQLTARLARRTP